MERFVGSNAAGVVLRLAIISIVVGIVLQALGLNPLDLVENIRALIRYISETGLDALEWLGVRLVVGAVVVVPIWLAVVLFRYLLKGSRSRE